MNQPQPHEWAQKYVSLVEGDVFEILRRQSTEFPEFINSLAGKANYAYAPGKWTIKELMGHIIDTERIYIYRMTCFARAEEQALPGFDENDYVANAHFADRNLHSLSEEFALLRKSNLYLFSSLTEKELNRNGIASGREVNVNILLYLTAGHIIHHTKIIKERYL